MTAVSTTSPTSTANQLHVEAFTILSEDDSAVSFESSGDLAFRLGAKVLGQAVPRGVVLLQLGTCGGRDHRVSVQNHGTADGGSAWDHDADLIDEAIQALEDVREQLVTMVTASEARKRDHNAITLGAEAVRLGVID